MSFWSGYDASTRDWYGFNSRYQLATGEDLGLRGKFGMGVWCAANPIDCWGMWKDGNDALEDFENTGSREKLEDFAGTWAGKAEQAVRAGQSWEDVLPDPVGPIKQMSMMMMLGVGAVLIIALKD